MSRHASALTAACLSAAVSVLAQDLRLVPVDCPASIDSIAECPDEGCGGVADALLNLAKNRVDAPSDTPSAIHVHDIVSIAEPADWLTGQPRDSIADDEGRAVQLIAFVKLVKKEGKETCNCRLGRLIDTDLHLVMLDNRDDLESDSISAEVTPRIRASSHPDWTLANLTPLEGKLVRLTGWLMLDTAHLHHSRLLPGEHPISTLNRASNWEVHPITSIEVCNGSVNACRQGTAWQTVQ